MSDKFMQQYFLLETLIKDIQKDLSDRIDAMGTESQIAEGKEYFPEGMVGLFIALLANAQIAATRTGEVRASLLACDRCLDELEKLKNATKDN
jgi:hypothetical protein